MKLAIIILLIFMDSDRIRAQALDRPSFLCSSFACLKIFFNSDFTFLASWTVFLAYSKDLADYFFCWSAFFKNLSKNPWSSLYFLSSSLVRGFPSTLFASNLLIQRREDRASYHRLGPHHHDERYPWPNSQLFWSVLDTSWIVPLAFSKTAPSWVTCNEFSWFMVSSSLWLLIVRAKAKETRIRRLIPFKNDIFQK